MIEDEQLSHRNTGKGIIHAPWEKAFTRILTPFEEFIHGQTSSGLLLAATTIIALVLANSIFAEAYLHLLHLPIALKIDDWVLEKTLQHWVNDGLMAFFFFIVGMELKREVLVGELADIRQAALPILAAIGGMALPAAIYIVFNPHDGVAEGWGIPMATDIAFAVGALVLLGNRVPKALITFLVALAIVDDLGAVLVIALFYTGDLSLVWLAIAASLVVVLVIFNLAGIRKIVPYFCVAVLLWLALLETGIHPTLAGVLGAFTVPTRPQYDPQLFSAHVKKLITRFDAGYQPDKSIMVNDELRSVLSALERGIRGVETPLQRLENIWHTPVAFLVIPVFALFNAGVPLQFGSWQDMLSHPVMLGVALGLVIGKFVGITGASWLALKLHIGQLPTGTCFTQIAGVSLLGGIGFTMSFFIAELAFATHPEHLLMAKFGILCASLMAGIAGITTLYFLSLRRN